MHCYCAVNLSAIARRGGGWSLSTMSPTRWSATIGRLMIDNGIERLALYGNLDITRDKVGLLHAQVNHPRFAGGSKP